MGYREGAAHRAISPLCKRKFFNHALYTYISLARARRTVSDLFSLFPLSAGHHKHRPSTPRQPRRLVDAGGNESARPFGERNDSPREYALPSPPRCAVSASREQITAIASVSWQRRRCNSFSSLSHHLLLRSSTFLRDTKNALEVRLHEHRDSFT